MTFILKILIALFLNFAPGVVQHAPKAVVPPTGTSLNPVQTTTTTSTTTTTVPTPAADTLAGCDDPFNSTQDYCEQIAEQFR